MVQLVQVVQVARVADLIIGIHKICGVHGLNHQIIEKVGISRL